MSSAGRALNSSESRGAGFVLVELIVVLIIAGLMVALTIPVFTSSMEGLRLKAAVRDVVSTMKHARSTAVFRQIPQKVSFDLDADTYRVAALVAGEDDGLPDGRRREVALHADLRISAMESGDERIESGEGHVVFYPDGSSSDGAVTIRNEKTDEVSTVTVDIFTGVATVSFGDDRG
ncbi:MAG: GspH/FimT family pseudopilin [Thermodesulfobacteriota bacterium]